MDFKKFALPLSTLGDKTAPAILFLHGFLGNREEWLAMAKHWQAEHQILAVDLPGHGDALFDEPAFYEMKNCAAQIATQLGDLALPKIDLVGYSMGGRLALYLAIHYPHLFHRILLIAASPGLEAVQEREKRAHADFLLARSLEKDDFGLFLKKWYDADLFSSLKDQPALLEQILQRRKTNSPKHLAMSLDQMGTGRQDSLWQNLTTIKVPLDLLVGTLDRKFLAIGQKMQQCNPALIKLHEIEKAGHAVHLENTPAFYEVMKKWRSQHDLNMRPLV